MFRWRQFNIWIIWIQTCCFFNHQGRMNSAGDLGQLRVLGSKHLFTSLFYVFTSPVLLSKMQQYA